MVFKLRKAKKRNIYSEQKTQSRVCACPVGVEVGIVGQIELKALAIGGVHEGGEVGPKE